MLRNATDVDLMRRYPKTADNTGLSDYLITIIINVLFYFITGKRTNKIGPNNEY